MARKNLEKSGREGLECANLGYTLMYSIGWHWQASDERPQLPRESDVAGQPVPSREEGGWFQQAEGGWRFRGERRTNGECMVQKREKTLMGLRYRSATMDESKNGILSGL